MEVFNAQWNSARTFYFIRTEQALPHEGGIRCLFTVNFAHRRLQCLHLAGTHAVMAACP